MKQGELKDVVDLDFVVGKPLATDVRIGRVSGLTVDAALARVIEQLNWN